MLEMLDLSGSEGFHGYKYNLYPGTYNGRV
jgi:hypothetical protein